MCMCVCLPQLFTARLHTLFEVQLARRQLCDCVYEPRYSFHFSTPLLWPMLWLKSLVLTCLKEETNALCHTHTPIHTHTNGVHFHCANQDAFQTQQQHLPHFFRPQIRHTTYQECAALLLLLPLLPFMAQKLRKMLK